MHIRKIMMPLLALLVGLAATGPALAAPPQFQTTNVVDEFNNVLGSSLLIRTDHGLSYFFETSQLDPFSVNTLWWVVFSADQSFFFQANASGTVANRRGRAFYAGHLSTGPLPPVDGQRVLVNNGSGVFDDPFGTFVRLVVRNHGPIVLGQLHEQLTTANGGCPPNTCVDIHIARFNPNP